jgi:hypothetical protein
MAGLGLYSLYYAITSPSAEQSGWWQLALIVMGLPVLIYQSNEANQSRWQPELQLGIVSSTNLDIYNLNILPSLPKEVTLDQRSTYFGLVIQNKGKLAARFVKIHLHHLPNQNSTPRDNTFGLVESSQKFTTVNTGDQIFRASADWVVYPHDTEVFFFNLRPFTSDEFRSTSYVFRCTLLADGIDKAIEETLSITVMTTPEFEKNINDTRVS